MPARVICMASAKGGSGKTSLTATFGTFLSQLGKKVLIVDADSATNGLTLLYIKEVRVAAELVQSNSRKPIGLLDAMSMGTHCDLVELGSQLHLIPASYSLQASEPLEGNLARERFKFLVSLYREDFDFILIDAQAGSDEMSTIAMSRKISDEVVIVTEYDPMSAAGVERLKGLLREDLTYDRTWVLLNKMLPEFVKSFSDFLEVAKYLSPIPWDAEVVRAYARRRLAIDSDTGNEYTLSIMQVLKGLCGESIHEELEAWLARKAAIIRQPIEEQYFDAERELRYILSVKSSNDRRTYAARWMGGTVAAGGFGALAYFVWHLGIQFNLWNSAHSGIWATAIAMFAGLGSVLLTSETSLLYSVIRSKDGVESQLQEARFDRQLEVLQDKLKRLEILRTLDPERLIKSRSRGTPDPFLTSDPKPRQ